MQMRWPHSATHALQVTAALEPKANVNVNVLGSKGGLVTFTVNRVTMCERLIVKPG